MKSREEEHPSKSYDHRKHARIWENMNYISVMYYIWQIETVSPHKSVADRIHTLFSLGCIGTYDRFFNN